MLTKPIQGLVAGITVTIGCLLFFLLLYRIRLKYKNPKYVPTSFLKKVWRNWEPAPKHHRLPDTNEHLEPISGARAGRIRPPSSFDANARDAIESSDFATTGAGVDRNTSVRSVMTLPAYHPSPRQNEQVLGREGERGGIDVVIEFPETVDEEEQQREEEMEALYQVRVARRRENEEREERRRLRREARERGDHVALRELQARARTASAASAGQTADELRLEHARLKERQRAVSSVSYGDLGVARHDGTRVRANSTESERQGLLGDAGSIAAGSRYHTRDRSTSSVLSIDSMNSDLPSPGLTRPRTNSRPENLLRRMSTTSQNDGTTSQEGFAGSSPEIINHEDVPPHSPPEYENISLETPQEETNHQEPPPGYSSPTLARGEEELMMETTQSRTTSTTHIGQLISNGGLSGSSSRGQSNSRSSGGEAHSPRGVGGIPQLPSLRIGSLPSIQVDSPTPIVGRTGEDEEHHNDE